MSEDKTFDLDTGDRTDIELQEALTFFRIARKALLQVAIASVKSTVRRHFPDARSFTTKGGWEPLHGSETVMRLNVTAVDTAEEDSEAWEKMEAELDAREALLLIGDLGDADYEGEFTFEYDDD